MGDVRVSAESWTTWSSPSRGEPTGWSIAAYDRETGDIVWHVLDDVQGYTSPMDVTVAGVRQILTVTADRVVGLSIDTGQLLWDFPWVTPTVPNMSQPIVLDANQIFLSSGYGHGAALIAVTQAAGQFAVDEVWRTNRMKNRFSSSVLHEGHIYGLDEAILACIDAATGELKWKGGRYGYGQLLLAGDHLVVLTEGGDLALVRATPDGHEEVGYSRSHRGQDVERAPRSPRAACWSETPGRWRRSTCGGPEPLPGHGV